MVHLLSIKFHYAQVGEEWILEPGMEAKLQDLLHDPEVLRYQRKQLDDFYGGKPPKQ